MNTKKGHSYNGILMGFILVLFISFTTGVHCNCIISYYRIGKLTSFVITSFRPTSLIECHQHQLPLVTCYSRSYVWLRFEKIALRSYSVTATYHRANRGVHFFAVDMLINK